MSPEQCTDIVQQVCWTAKFQKKDPRLDEDSVGLAVRTYFLAPS